MNAAELGLITVELLGAGSCLKQEQGRLQGLEACRSDEESGTEAGTGDPEREQPRESPSAPRAGGTP